jgi:hypothetical protein
MFGRPSRKDSQNSPSAAFLGIVGGSLVLAALVLHLLT